MSDTKATTDRKGNYTIVVPAESNLYFRKSGYGAYSVPVTNSGTVNVQIVRE